MDVEASTAGATTVSDIMTSPEHFNASASEAIPSSRYTAPACPKKSLPSSSALIASGGYASVILLMAIQSACIPIPSEVIMPLAGYALAHIAARSHHPRDRRVARLQPRLHPRLLGRRPRRTPHGRALRQLSSSSAAATSTASITSSHRYGSIAVLIGRMLPIVRTFIAFPAGVAKMNQLRFHIYTFIGSWPWCYALAYVGMKLGDDVEHRPSLQGHLPPLPPRRRARSHRRLPLVRHLPLEEPHPHRRSLICARNHVTAKVCIITAFVCASSPP